MILISSLPHFFSAGSLLQAEFHILDQKAATAILSDRNCLRLTDTHELNGGVRVEDKASCGGPTCTPGTATVGARWRLLKSLTSGVFCTSLNKNTAFSSPFYFDAPRHESSTAIQLGQYFPEESVCTENIDKWKKLIPNIPLHEIDSTTDSRTIENEYDNSLKGLIDKNWLLYSPWHSLRFEARSGLEINASDNFNTPQRKKWRSKQEISMTLSVSAILLPKTVPSHSKALTRLMEFVKKRENNQPSGLENDVGQQAGSKKAKKINLGPCGVRLHRQVKDSRERNFYTEMIVEDTSCTTTQSEEHSLPSIQTCSIMTSKGACPSDLGLGSTTVHVTELLPPFYDLLLHTYTYTIIQKFPVHPKNETRTKDLYVADLESFTFHPGGLNDNQCYNRKNVKESHEEYKFSPDNDYGESSRSCYGSISWSIDLPLGGVLRSQFTAEKKFLHREHHPSDASRGFIVPPVFVTLTSKVPIPGKI